MRHRRSDDYDLEGLPAHSAEDIDTRCVARLHPEVLMVRRIVRVSEVDGLAAMDDIACADLACGCACLVFHAFQCPSPLSDMCAGGESVP